MRTIIPAEAIRLEKYEELREVLLELCYSDPVANPASVAIFGPPEVGKTTMVDSIFGDDNSYRAPAHLTPLSLYVLLFEQRDRTVIFDDPNVDGDMQVTREILMKVTERTPRKTLSWARTLALRASGAPRRFETRTRILSIANGTAPNSATEALASRTDSYSFVPSKAAWLEYVRSYWPQDPAAQEILKYVEARFTKIRRFGCRVMDKALRASRSNRVHVPWWRYLEPMFGA